MPLGINELYNRAESLKGAKLLAVVIAIFLFFIPAGIFIGNYISPILNNSEEQQPDMNVDMLVTDVRSYSGKVIYVDPKLYPQDGISYALLDSAGVELLLRAKDEKLSVVEGLDVVVFGKLEKTMDKSKDILLVDKVIVKNK